MQDLYTQKAKLYQSFFVNFLKWEITLKAFFRDNHYLHSKMKILDAGCGTGSVTKVLYDFARHQGFVDIDFYAFDLTPAMLVLFGQWVEKESADNIHMQQANVLDLENQLPQGWDEYDLIVTSAMLEYVPKDQLSQALGNLMRLLADNGRLLIFVTKKTWIGRWTGGKWWKTNLFDPNEIETYLRQVGFNRVQFKKLPAAWGSFMLAVEADSAPR